MKIDEIHSEGGRRYFTFWMLALRNVLGWPDSQIEDFAERYRKFLDADEGIFFHWEESDYVAGQFINADLRSILKMHGGLDATIEELQRSISAVEYPDLIEGRGWDEAKNRIAEVIERARAKYCT